MAAHIKRPNFPFLIRRFLHDQLRRTGSNSDSSFDGEHNESRLPHFHGKLALYTSAVAMFYASSDLSGVGGMRREHVRALPAWRGGPARYDCVLVHTNADADGMLAYDVARARLFFSFKFKGKTYLCALVDWFSRATEQADADTGMWIVQQDADDDGVPTNSAVIHLGSIVRCAHLIGVYGPHLVPRELTFSDSLDAFRSFYVNKYADHHMYETVF